MNTYFFDQIKKNKREIRNDNPCESDICEAPDDTDYVKDILDSKMRSFQEVCSVQQSVQRTLQTVTIPDDFVSFKSQFIQS